MALRVLLADESSTIKKVIQLALQDYAVEVKTVPVGLDVLPVAKTFKPDIIFADVLLSKKNGYDVSQELKSDNEMKKTPVVLMWSGFMELDEAKAKSSMADDRLEKPFDAEALRGLVRKHVPRTQTNPVSSFLTFPPMPEFQEDPTALKISEEKINVDSLPSLEEEEFTQVPLHHQATENPSTEDNWTQQPIKQFKIPSSVPQSPSSANTMTAASVDIEKFIIPEASDLGPLQVQSEGEFEEVSFNVKTALPKAEPQAHTQIQAQTQIQNKPMTATETVLLERVAREEARAIIENICWKILPEITERIVREEINKILKQAEKNS